MEIVLFCLEGLGREDEGKLEGIFAIFSNHIMSYSAPVGTNYKK